MSRHEFAPRIPQSSAMRRGGTRRWSAADSRRAGERQDAGRHPSHRPPARDRTFPPGRSWPSPSPTKRPTRCGRGSNSWRPASRSGWGRFIASAPRLLRQFAGFRRPPRELLDLRHRRQPPIARRRHHAKHVDPEACDARHIWPRPSVGPRTISSRPTTTPQRGRRLWKPIVERVYPAYQRRLLTRQRRRLRRPADARRGAAARTTPNCGARSTSVTATSWSTNTRTRTWPSTRSCAPCRSTIRTWR